MDALKYILETYSIDANRKGPIPLSISRFGDFIKIMRRVGYSTGIEIGVDRGRFSEAICRGNPGVSMYCVDPWITYDSYHDIEDQDKMTLNEQVARDRLSAYGCKIIKKTSMEAVKDFDPCSVDFVWIDGNHRFDYAVEDIIHWEKIVRVGGIVAGHDYVKRDDYGVIQAVNAYTDYHNIKPWFTLAKDKSPGWFWVKV